MLKKIKGYLTSKGGVSLVETLVALTILTIMIFFFLPLFANYLKNIKAAGEISQQTQFKVSIMERLIANKGNNNKYFETPVADVPITFNYGDSQIVFNTTDGNHINGTTIISDPIGGQNSYATYYANSASARMVCFPSELTDDFIETNIAVVAKGFKFADVAANKNASPAGYHFKVFYTNTGGGIQEVPVSYYDIRYELDGDEKIAIFTFYGGNNVISFENSPLYIKYGFGNSDNLQYSVKVEIGAPEIIMVGEKASDGNYYYYSTSGVDSNGNMAIIAKQMNSAPLTSAMNDVEWVSKGMGDDGNGGTNKYGYYVMGGDAGQVRRFWKNNETGNYYWGGDYLNNYDRRYDRAGDASYENFNKSLTTQASFKNIYRGNAGTGFLDASDYSVLVEAEKDTLGHKYQAAVMNSFTANATDTFYLTVGGIAKGKSWYKFPSWYTFNAYPFHSDMHQDNYDAVIAWYNPSELATLTGISTMAGAYRTAMNYEYPTDNSLITITSVGAIQINKENSMYSEIQANSKQGTANVYPTKSYTLYCGYIPAVTDVYGWKTSNAGGWSKYVYMGSLGVASNRAATADGKATAWYPTGKFGDLQTRSETVNYAIFGTNPSYKDLLNYYSESDDNTTFFPNATKNGDLKYYKAKEGGRIGQVLTGQGQDYYITGGHEIDITVGYLSEPYAIDVSNPTTYSVRGANSAAKVFHTFNGVGNFGHSYTSAGLRDNVTMLDVKSYHDDLTGNNISFAVGYSLSYLCNDYSWATRIGQVFNSGLVYIRATGNGLENDTKDSTASGKGWSLARETNVFHQFYGTDQYQDGQPNGSTGKSALGWDTYYHRAYFNVSSNTDKAPQNGYSPSLQEGNNSFGTSCHPMADTKCTTVNKGITWDEKAEIMWGTENGTLLSWKYDYENPKNSKITAVTKEFESYMWIDRLGIAKPFATNGSDDAKRNFYDYSSVDRGMFGSYGFISTLKKINDVAYGDGYWVAVGEQGYTKNADGTYTHKDPRDYSAVNAYAYPMGHGLSQNVGSYINVKYEVDPATHFWAWKAVKVDNDPDINFISVTYVKGVWYALGYRDSNHNGVNDHNGTAYIYWSTDPSKSWTKAKTATVDATGNYIYSDTATALYFNGSSVNSINLTGVNSMASRG